MPPITRGDKNQGCPHESKGNTKNYPRGCQAAGIGCRPGGRDWNADRDRREQGPAGGGAAGWKLPERKLNLLYRPFAKVGKAALMLYSVPFVLAWILMLFGLTPSSLTQFPGGDVVVILITLAAGWTGYLIRPI